MALNRADRLGRRWSGTGHLRLVRPRLHRFVTPTTEHVVPRLKGGPSWPENEVAACRRCNSERGHRGPVDG